ncbi:MAG: peptidylprolyl isomerase [Candidatus Buchananbacteria bacterium]|nr:peptidylprolyl isomerase [Candidatus Buchananbacteria bacterium]
MSENNTASSTQATIKTNLGDITIKLYREDAPETVANFIKLASSGFYNGIKFHRIIKDFMIQSGDPLTKDDSLKDRWGTGGPGYKFEDEINNHKLVEGSVAMANSGPDTNGSQFFIVTTKSTPWLDGKHTNFGEVISGLDIVKLIESTPTDQLDRPSNDVVINAIELQ